MNPRTAQLWTKHDRDEGDRWRLFSAVAGTIDAATVFYPGSYVDIAPSFVFDSVTYLDKDKRTPKFFADTDGLREIVCDHEGPSDPDIRFVHAGDTRPLDLSEHHFDLLVSLYAGFISEHCTSHLASEGRCSSTPATVTPRWPRSILATNWPAS